MAAQHMGPQPGYGGPAMAAQLAPGTMPVQFQVPNESMGAVIGRAGATINQIRQMSGAKVRCAPRARIDSLENTSKRPLDFFAERTRRSSTDVRARRSTSRSPCRACRCASSR